MGFEENLRKVAPYAPGEQPKDLDVIKLNTNENPYPPTPKALKALSGMNEVRMKLYPPTDAGDLGKALAEYYGQKQENTFVGVGSDDVIATIFLTCFNSKKPVLFPDITYSFYDVWADLYNIPYKMLPLDENFRVRKEDYLQENGGIVIANPNAPTSVAMDAADVEFIIKNNPDSVVVVDEAYVDFGGVSVLPLLEKYDNLIVVRTFSKSRSMAGVRIGFCFASKRIIDAMNDVKFSINSYTMNITSIIAGVEAVKDDEYFKNTVAKVVVTRERSAEMLKELGFTVLPSSTNFLFVSHNRVPAEEIFTKLKAKKIFVRFWNKPRINNFLRITVGTDEQMDALKEALQDILK